MESGDKTSGFVRRVSDQKDRGVLIVAYPRTEFDRLAEKTHGSKGGYFCGQAFAPNGEGWTMGTAPTNFKTCKKEVVLTPRSQGLIASRGGFLQCTQCCLETNRRIA
jgi:hypothetical protein